MSLITNGAFGALAGVAGAVPMTLVMERLHRELPTGEREPLPPRQITEHLSEHANVAHHMDEGDMRAASYANHFAYGAATGAVFGNIARRLPMSPIVSGVTFALGVWTISYFGWLPALKILPPADEHAPRRNAIMILAHVVWGASMGLVLSIFKRPRRG